MKTKRMARLLAVALALSLLASPISALATTVAGPIYDATPHTAFITHKSAEWTNAEEFLAEVTLRVNGTQVTEPLDVIIVMDRSGSMDMDYVQPAVSTKDGKEYLTFASCPCLNQDHFYLEPTGETHDAGWRTDTNKQVYNSDEKTLTVYNAQDDKWVELDADPDKRVHLYYEFGHNTLYYTPYHFKMVDGDYVRISKWVDDPAVDVRIPAGKGMWDHADKDEDCFDRFMEAKEAVKEFSAELLNADERNKVAFVPFSIRDKGVVDYLNNKDATSKNLRSWLIKNEVKYFGADSGVTVADGALSGEYSSMVGLTRDITKIEATVDRLFTTPNTDYIYGLSQAYNLIAAREGKLNNAVVVFLSDGKPYMESNWGGKSEILSFANRPKLVEGMIKVISNPVGTLVDGQDTGTIHLWNQKGTWLRNDINQKYYQPPGADGIEVGPLALGVPIVTVGYMVSDGDSVTRLKNMASAADGFIEIKANDNRITKNELVKKLLNATVYPGGSNAVLRDEISKYFYVNPDFITKDIVDEEVDVYTTYQSTNPAIAIQQFEDGREFVIWTIGSIYKYETKDEPSITVPLVLKEDYRKVSTTTYYPTNADKNPDPPLDDPNNGPDDPDNGARLDYDDPNNEKHYDTIGTPKLPVNPEKPSNPGGGRDPDPPKPEEPKPEEQKPEEPKPEEPKPEEPTPEEPTPEEPTPEEPPTPTRPQPTDPGNTLEPGEDGSFIEMGEDGTPLGAWQQDGKGNWVFIRFEDIPLGALPQTGSTAMRGVLPLSLVLIAIAFLLIGRHRPYYGRRTDSRR